MERRTPTVAVLGAGARGNAYSSYLLSNPHAGRIIAVADADAERLERFGELHRVPRHLRFSDYEQFLQQPKMTDAVLICLQDKLHYEATIAALEKGYHVMVEKPMSPEPLETLHMAEKAEEAGRVLTVCHVLRHTPFFEKIKQLIRQNAIGDVVSIDLIENVEHIHYSHSYVRGNWSNSSQASTMLLSKSCHDIDIVHWLVDKTCTRVSSFGSQYYFNAGFAPQGATKRCTDGCAVERSCPFSAIRVYVENDSWYSYITNSSDKASRMTAIRQGPYGRCVYYSDNDVVDHQVVLMEFEKGVTASFTMNAFTKENTRTIKVFGTHGQIRGHMSKNEIEVSNWAGETELIKPRTSASGHGGGDHRLMQDFLAQLGSDHPVEGRTGARASAESHLIAFAAEESRLKGTIVDLSQYASALRRTLAKR